MSEVFLDYFSSLAASYATFRPDYPAELVARVAGLAPERTCAWDCATGNGQAALLLANHFERVVATDGSEAQLAQARAHPRVTYRKALAEDSGLESGAIALVTVAQALHWFDLPRFHREVARVLMPRGVLAAWCYALARVDPAVDAILTDFDERRIARHWSPRRRHVMAFYRDLDFPFDEIDVGGFEMSARFSLGSFLGYVATWSSVARARESEGRDPLVELAHDLERVWPRAEERIVRWPVGVRVGRRRD
jgi:SAM-dependent methyltransferase